MWDLASNLAFGFDVALSPVNLLYCLVGVTVGTMIGVLPGIGPLTAIALLLPVTFGMPPVTALIMLAGIYYGAMYGGSTAAILINLPGSAPSAIVCLDGYPMSQQGRAGPALFMTTIASFVGGCVSIVVIAVLAPTLAGFAMSFGAPEYFSLMLFALVAAGSVAHGSILKSFGMILFGIMIGLVGIDVNSGVIRFNLGFLELADGVSLVIVALGTFGIAEVLNRIDLGANSNVTVARVRLRDLLPTRDDTRRSVSPIGRGTGIGAILGVLPGAGSTLASFLAYSVEKRIAAQPERFGKGAIEGVAAPEAANNSAAQTAFIPTLTLGIPGDAIMALMLGALLVHGITPGPQVMVNNADLFWGLVASMWIGNLTLLLLNIPLVGIWVRMLSIPYRILYPLIVILVCGGVFSLRLSGFDVMLVLVFGVLGWMFLRLGCQPAPMLLGLILGPMLETYLRRSMILSRGDPTIFFERPISAAFLAITAILIGYAVWQVVKAWRTGSTPTEG